MKLSAKLIELNKYYIQEEVDDIYEISALPEESHTIIADDIGNISYKQIAYSGMILIDVKMKLRQIVTDVFKIQGENVMMEFMYSSNIKADIDDLEWGENDLTHTHNITFSKNYCGKFKMKPNIPVRFFIIILSKEYYFNLIPHDFALHKEFVHNIYKQKTALLSKTMLQFNPSIHSVINEIRACKRKGELKRLYIENKIRELLLLQLEIIQEQHLINSQSGLSNHDYKKLLDAKHILDSNFKAAPKISELARMSYLNEFKLKKGFKAYFGKTIKSYVISLRMKHAIELLNEEKHTISEIAYLCGYNGIIQFSNAFKSFYGCSPKSFRNTSLQSKLFYQNS